MFGAGRAFYLRMDSGLYAAYTGLLARTQALDTAANNLANAGTAGFRAERDYFRGVLASGLTAGSQGSQVGNSVNGFGVLGGSAADFALGPMANTGNPLDLAINGAGFFSIETKQGIRYTRDGAFTRSPAGVLETGAGEPVLDAQGKQIEMPSGAIAVSADGILSVDGNVVARLGVVNFADPGGLVAEGGSRFAAPAGVTPTAADGEVKQGAVEGANQDVVHGTMQLMLVQRQAEMMQKALSVFDNSFDKPAAEELGRVS